MTSSHHGPYDQGYTRATMAHTKRSDLARASGPHKVRRSPDWSLHLDSMKSESLCRGSECHGEYVHGLYTPPVTWEWVAKEVGSLTFGGRLPLCDS